MANDHDLSDRPSRLPRAAGLAVGVALFAGTLWGADLALRATGRDDLTTRAIRVDRTIDWMAEGDPRVIAGDCPRYRFKAGDDADHGPPRDARGWRTLTTDGPTEPIVVVVVGDSVMYGGMAPLLERAFADAGVAARIVDTSVYGYGLADEACILREVLVEQAVIDPDLVILGIVHNDLPVAEAARVTHEGRTWDVQTTSYLESDLATARLPPLLLDSRDPWVQARRADLLARWPDRIVFDWTGHQVLSASVERLRDPSNPGHTVLDAVTGTMDTAPRAAVTLLFPLNYHREPNPLDPLMDATLDLLRGAQHPVVDLRPVLRPFPSDDLVPLGEGHAQYAQGHGTHDLLHYGAPGLALAAEAGLRAVDDPTLAAALSPVRAALHRLASDAAPCGGWVCDDVPASTPHRGITAPNAACRSSGPRDCSTPRDTPRFGAGGFRNAPAGLADDDRDVMARCMPVIRTLEAAYGPAYVDEIGTALREYKGMDDAALMALCDQQADQPADVLAAQLKTLAGVEVPP